jgi:hypothetical protein
MVFLRKEAIMEPRKPRDTPGDTATSDTESCATDKPDPHLDERLDEELDETFPASDPIPFRHDS